jgi:rhodanese-related sulfurtransferase
MKTYLDLVASAKLKIQLIPLEHAESAMEAADLLIDVREESEYKAGHLPGAVHMSRGVVEAYLSMKPEYHKPETKIVLYCRTDARAALVAVSLQEMGYTHVKALAGGYSAWTEAGHSIEQ